MFNFNLDFNELGSARGHCMQIIVGLMAAWPHGQIEFITRSNEEGIQNERGRMSGAKISKVTKVTKRFRFNSRGELSDRINLTKGINLTKHYLLNILLVLLNV